MITLYYFPHYLQQKVDNKVSFSYTMYKITKLDSDLIGNFFTSFCIGK